MLDLGTPDDFRGQPSAWLNNQMSHFLVGIAGAWLLMRLGVPGWGGVLGAALTSCAIEVVQLRRGGTVSDGLTDFLYVVAGALWQAVGGAFWLFAIIAIDLAVGVRLRSVERDAGAQFGDI